MPSSIGATAREAYLEQHKAQMQAALAKAVNAALAAQPDDPIAFVGKQLLQRDQREAQTAKEEASEPEECTLMTKDGKAYKGTFATKWDAEKGDLTAQMQRLRASGVEQADILACCTGGGDDASMYNVEACRQVMSGMDAAGLNLNNKAARAVMAEAAKLTDASDKEVDWRALHAKFPDWRERFDKAIQVGTLPAAPGSPEGDYVFMVVQREGEEERMYYGDHKPDADGARSAHMKQCMAVGCDPKEVEFAGSVRKGAIHTNSLFNSNEFKTALSALDRAKLLDTPGGHEARGQLKERFALTPCTPEQMQQAAELLANGPTETTDDMMYARKLGDESLDAILDTDRWKLEGRSLNDEDVKFLIERALSSGRLPAVKEIDLGKNQIQDEGVQLLIRALSIAKIGRAHV